MNKEIHETVGRLYEAAKDLKNISNMSGLARLLNVSPQTIKNWEARGISSKGAIEAAEKIGFSKTTTPLHPT